MFLIVRQSLTAVGFTQAIPPGGDEEMIKVQQIIEVENATRVDLCEYDGILKVTTEEGVVKIQIPDDAVVDLATRAARRVAEIAQGYAEGVKSLEPKTLNGE